MPIQYNWILENEILILKYSNPTSEDVHQLNDDMMSLLNTLDSPIYLVSDTTEIGKFPTSLVELKSNAAFLRHPNLRMIISVGMASNPMVVFMAKALSSLVGVRFFDSSSVEEALEIIYKDNKHLHKLTHD
jgi:hypothetical protein